LDVAFVIRQRLEEFGLEQRDLAQAADVTDSYISQLLTGKKKPPAPNRTDIYDKMDRFLKLPRGELATLADHQRKEQLKRELGEEPTPLFREVRELILKKCKKRTRAEVRAVFERHPFGELERLVTGTLVDVVKAIAQGELENERWLCEVAEPRGRSYAEMRVIVLEFLDADIFRVSKEHCDAFLDPLIDSWEIDRATFAIDVVMSDPVVGGHRMRFEFLEVDVPKSAGEPGLAEFLADPALSGTLTAEELDHLKRLRFRGRRPTPIYYYRALQNLRDPLHFRPEGDPS